MKPRVLYLHGFASGPASRKARFFQEQLRAAGVEVDVPDLSEGSFEGLTIGGQLQVVERLAQGTEGLRLIGSSLGGYLAALYAARHPEVERLVLLAPAFDFARRWTESLGRKRLEEWKSSGRMAVYHYAGGREQHVGYQLVEDALAYEAYPSVTQPTLVYHGTGDTVVPAAFSMEFVRGRPNVRLELLNAGHDLIEALQTIWEGVRRFLL